MQPRASFDLLHLGDGKFPLDRFAPDTLRLSPLPSRRRANDSEKDLGYPREQHGSTQGALRTYEGGMGFTDTFTESFGIFLRKALQINARNWRRGSESNAAFTDFQPQYPDLQGFFSIDFKGVQALFATIRPLPALTRRAHPACSVIEEIVEGFVEGFLPNSAASVAHASPLP